MTWSISPSTQYLADLKWYGKKKPKELAAVLNNLERYLSILEDMPNSKSFTMGFMHTEQAGVIALDQSGGGKNLQETRLYLYADDEDGVVHLITIGNKFEQPSDVLASRNFVSELRKN